MQINYFSFYGILERITKDNGKGFKNETVSELLRCHKIKIDFTTPFHHESNSSILGSHSTLTEHLKLLRELHKKDSIKTIMKYAIIAIIIQITLL